MKTRVNFFRKYRCSIRLILMLLVFFLTAGALMAQHPAEFKAGFTTTDAKGKTIDGTIYIKGDKIRQEIEEDGATTITILRLDRKLSWILMPENKYMEVPLPIDPNQPQNQEYGIATIGQETVNGYNCEIIQYTYTKKSLGVLVQWIAKDLNYAVKTEAKNAKGKLTSRTEYHNITPTKLADSLFEIPAGYSKFSLFGN